jgi:hypothetical protein
MSVRNENRRRPPPSLIDFMQDAISVQPRIDNDAFFVASMRDKIRVLGKQL